MPIQDPLSRSANPKVFLREPQPLNFKGKPNCNTPLVLLFDYHYPGETVGPGSGSARLTVETRYTMGRRW